MFSKQNGCRRRRVGFTAADDGDLLCCRFVFLLLQHFSFLLTQPLPVCFDIRLTGFFNDDFATTILFGRSVSSSLEYCSETSSAFLLLLTLLLVCNPDVPATFCDCDGCCCCYRTVE